ncbi:hypothetical protein Tco_1227488, partial [Tanacetum coccineum]
MKIDRVTHKPRITSLGFAKAEDIATQSHMTRWENARLEAKARLAVKRHVASKSQRGSLHMASSSTDFDATRGWAEEPVAPPAAAEAEPKNPREEL